MGRAAATRTALASLFDGAPSPLYVVDDRRRIVFCNQAFCHWIGHTAEQLVGQECHYHSQPTTGIARVCAALCPPPESLAGQFRSGTVAIPVTEDRHKYRSALFVPLTYSTADSPGVVVVIADADLPETGDRNTDLLSARDEAHDWHQRLRRHRETWPLRFAIEHVVGTSPIMRRVQQQIGIAVSSPHPILIWGPPGSGREHVARTIHGHGQAATQRSPLTPLACPLLDADLLTSTVQSFIQRCAELKLERPGALLLLEADQLRPDAQTALWEFMQVHELELHFLATSRQPLIELSQRQKFRTDLAFALSILEIELKPLQERREDIPLLAQHILEQCNAAGKRQLGGFTREALDALSIYEWPKNIDELAAAIRHAHHVAQGALVGLTDLPEQIHLAQQAAAHPQRTLAPIDLEGFLRDMEQRLIQQALRHTKGNKSKACQLLGMQRARLLRRLAALEQPPAKASELEEEVQFEPVDDDDVDPWNAV